MGSRKALQPGLGQLPLLGTEEWGDNRISRPRPKRRLMFVFKPPAALTIKMNEDAAFYVASQNDRPPHPANLLHMSLVFVEEFEELPKALIRKAIAAAEEIRARPIPITLDSAGLFGATRHLALYPRGGNVPIWQFTELLGNALKRQNLPHFRAKDSTPHVTLVYGCGKIEPMPIERNYAWIAGEFMLVCSHIGETRHDEIGRWSLDPAAPAYVPRPQQLQFRI
jgi:2'-5' RNA ligase